MPCMFTHAFVGLAAAGAVSDRSMPGRIWLLAPACAMLPDLDVIGFAYNVPYYAPLGHRGFFHGLPFALLIGLGAAFLCWRYIEPFTRRWWLLAGFFTALAASHGLLDTLTNGGYGIALFSPFTHERYFAPWTPIQVSPMRPADFFSVWGWRAFRTELLVVWLPVTLGLLLARLIGRSTRRRTIEAE